MADAPNGWRSVIQALADGEAAAIGTAVELEAERDHFRTMVGILLQQTREQAALIERQRETIARNRDELRRLREHLLVNVKVAA